MRIEIDPGTANDPDSHRWLDRILHKIEDEWHVWDTNKLNTSEMCATTWINDAGRQGKRIRSMLVESIQRDAWNSAPHGRSVRVTTAPGAPDELAPEDACRLAETPLCILVENRYSDGAFVKRVVKELDESLQTVWDRPGEPIQIDSVGGKGQMAQEVERRAAENQYRPRLVAIIDSDRKGPDDPVSREAQQLSGTCANKNLACWILAKREAENYLPRVLLDSRPGARHKERVEAWDRLNDNQKNFFDMKQGFRRKSAEGQLLFDGLSEADREALFNGFGNDVHECWTYCEVSARQELKIRGQGDLERGLCLIRREV